MKILRHFLILLGFTLPQTVRAQYVPIPLQVGTTWRLERYSIFGFYPSYFNDVSVIKDSVVSGRRYAVLSDGNLIRNDSTRKRVYGIPKRIGVDTLLFDFAIHRGDTIRNWYTLCQFNLQSGCTSLYGQTGGVSAPIYYWSEDSVQIGQVKRRRIFLVDNGGTLAWPTSWILEGVGTSAGLFGKMNQLYDSSSNLVCMNGVVVNDQYQSCNSLLMPVRENKRAFFSIHTNPSHAASTVLEITANQLSDQPVEASLFSTAGALMDKRMIRFTSGKAEYPIHNTTPGLYLIQLRTPHAEARSRIVIY